jgi:hypothetical protein
MMVFPMLGELRRQIVGLPFGCNCLRRDGLMRMSGVAVKACLMIGSSDAVRGL